MLIYWFNLFFFSFTFSLRLRISTESLNITGIPFQGKHLLAYLFYNELSTILATSLYETQIRNVLTGRNVVDSRVSDPSTSLSADSLIVSEYSHAAISPVPLDRQRSAKYH